MKIKINRARFADALAQVKSACESKATVDILRCARIRTNVGAVEITATNLTTTVKAFVDCEVVEGGECAVVFHTLAAFVGALPDGEVELSIAASAARAKVSGGCCRYSVAADPAGKFPEEAEMAQPSSSFDIDAEKLRTMLCMVDYAASNNEARRILSGVAFELRDGLIQLVATDGGRLSTVELETKVDGGERSAVVPIKTVKLLAGLLSKGVDRLRIEVCDDRMRATGWNGDAIVWVVLSKLVCGKFPAWRNIVPATEVNVATFDRIALAAELKRVGLSTDESMAVKFGLVAGTLTLKAQDGDLSTAETAVVAKYDGEKVEAVLNPRLVLDVLECLEADEVRVSFGEVITIRAEIPFLAIVGQIRK